VITGAGAGIGRALAVRLSEVGCPTVIVDLDEVGLGETASMLTGPRLVRQLDVRDRQALNELAHEVGDWAPGPLGAVFNNAGVAVAASLADGAVEDDDWLHAINFGGVVNGVRAFLPILLEQRSGAIVNMSSALGLVGSRYQSAYCASKFAVRGFTEALRHELMGTGVQAIAVHPGGVRTAIARRGRVVGDPKGLGRPKEQVIADLEAVARTTPERAAELMRRAVEAGKPRVLIGLDAYAFDIAARVAPARYFKLVDLVHVLAHRNAAEAG
jgi:NADP-dependent 3-hydroxy acid dehydrogenase YdfG